MIAASYGWQMSDAGNMFFRGRGNTFVDPSIVAPVGWPCRTTLVQPTNRAGEWYALEVCQPWAELSDLIAALPHGECEIICIMTEGIEETINMAAMVFPSLRRQLQPSWDLAFSWMREEPPTHPLAPPWQILCAMLTVSITWGGVKVAAILALCWGGLARVGEVLAARRDLVLPRHGRQYTTPVPLGQQA